MENFRDYLRINSMQPNPNYEAIRTFLVKMAGELGLPVRVIECVKGKPIILITWKGSQPELPSVLLNSHTDVVPVYIDSWHYPPFEATMLENGDIVARGAQDMKCVGMGYIEALRVMRRDSSFQPVRTLHVCFVPDEEIGGHDGMEKFVQTPEFKELNVGFALDEGVPSPIDGIFFFVGERAPWWVTITATGETGHGSSMPSTTAPIKLVKVMNKLLEFRDQELHKLKTLPNGLPINLGSVTSLNITKLEGGVQLNVIPSSVSVGVDMRVTPSMNISDLEKMLDEICAMDEGVSWKAEQSWRDQSIVELPPSEKATSFANNLCATHKKKFAHIPVIETVFPASTDARYLRAAGIPALGITPSRNTKILAHNHNEYLNAKEFIAMVEWYTEIIPSLLLE